MELKLSDEQYEKIWLQTVRKLPSKPNVGTAVEGGHAAVDAVLAEVLPVVLAEPSAEEIDEALCQIPTDIPWRLVDYNRARRVFTNRLARFTAPKDVAVERIVGPEFRMADGTLAKLSQEAAELIADTVRDADREAGR